MQCNKDEAIRSREISVKKLSEKNTVLAKKLALKAQNLYPNLEGLPQLLATLDVYISAENKIYGEIDWYGVLSVDPLADDDAIRRHYRKLALMLHPDKNKLPGADGAFKILSEAWSLLSDKVKRSVYDQKRNICCSSQKPPPKNLSVPVGRNNFHNFNSGADLNATNQTSASFPKPPAPVSRPSKRSTFWTACNCCKMQYEYLTNYLNHTLLCPNCHEPFLAVQTSPPPLNGPKSSTPWDSYQKQHTSSTHTTNMNYDGLRSHFGGAPWTSRAGFSGHANSQSNFTFKSSCNGNLPASASPTAQATHLCQPEFNRFKRGCEEAQVTGSFPSPQGERRMKKRHTDINTAQAAGRDMANQMPLRNGVDMENLSAIPRRNPEISKVIFVGGNRFGITRDQSQLEIRNLLMQKAQTEIRKKLNEFKMPSAWNDSIKNEKQKRKEKQGAAVTAVKHGGSLNEHSSAASNKGEEKLPPGSNVESDDAKNTAEPVAMNVPDPDFYDFDKDRMEMSFAENQVWAAYDDDDGMPRYYAIIHGVVSKRPFKMRISWLNSKSNNELSPIHWIGSGFPKTMGDFRAGKHEFNSSLNSFSHKVKWVKGARGIINIYPSMGEVWALYRNWSPEWNEFTSDEVIHKYDMFEVLEDYSDAVGGATVTPLVKVAGFRTLFHRHLDPSHVRTIPREELFRFSHQVPSHLITGQEAPNAPRGCRELDPAATPLELLQVATEVKGEELVEDVEKFEDDAAANVKGTIADEMRAMRNNVEEP